MTKKTYKVYDHNRNYIGEAGSFAEAKTMQSLALKNEPELLERYAGLDCSGDMLKHGTARPQFYVED
jgi:hypothetical protein